MILTGAGSASAAVGAGQRRLGQGMGMQIEADEGGGRRLVNRKLVEVQRENREHVAMRLGARWRAWPAVADTAEIGPDLDRARGRQARFRIAGVPRQERGARRYVDDHPMPPAAAG